MNVIVRTVIEWIEIYKKTQKIFKDKDEYTKKAARELKETIGDIINMFYGFQDRFKAFITTIKANNTFMNICLKIVSHQLEELEDIMVKEETRDEEEKQTLQFKKKQMNTNLSYNRSRNISYFQ